MDPTAYTMRLVLLGNAGSGKTTLARRLQAATPMPLLSLDDIAWNPGPRRKPLDDSLSLLHRFVQAGERWIIEGCYGDLIEAALPYSTELRFLNPGVEACVAHCRGRPWEPDKFSTPQAQNAGLGFLIDWVRSYETRDDEFGLKRHRRLFDGFGGAKREYTSVAEYG